MERGRLLVVFDDRVSSLNNEEDVLLKRDIEVWVIMVGNAKRLFRWSVFAQIQKKTEHILMLDHHFGNSHEAYFGHVSVGGQERWRQHVFHDVQYAHVAETYAIAFFRRLEIAQQTLQYV